MFAILARTLVFSGAVILVASFFVTRRLVEQVGDSRVRRYWYLMLGLILVFVLGYLGYAWRYWSLHAEPLDLIVPVILFLGACFVWLTARLSLQTIVAVTRVRILERENVLDPLTGVFNRRHLDRRLSEEISRARRGAEPLAVLLVDIDHFKRINDELGHQVGDEVLVFFARRIVSQLREPDTLARYGGEEFMVIAPGTTPAGALALAERLRAHIEAADFRPAGAVAGATPLRMTCSIGVGSLGGAVQGAEQLVAAADESLYAAKRNGRNQVGADGCARGGAVS